MGAGSDGDGTAALGDGWTLGRSTGHTHVLLLGFFIQWEKRSVTRFWHSKTPLEQAVLMAFTSLYLPR